MVLVYIILAAAILTPILYLVFTYGIWILILAALIAMWYIYFKYNKTPKI